MNSIDIKTFSLDLNEEMKTQLDVISQDNQDITSQASLSLNYLKSCMRKLKEFVCQYEFKDREEEIDFFKRIKPVIASQYYYHNKLFSIKVNEPLGGPDTLRRYYYRELDRLQEFIRVNQEFYRYYLNNLTHLDDKYFIRQDGEFGGIELDSRFSTGYDNKLATILANQMLKEYLLVQIKKLDLGPSPLTWTGRKAALIELIYALQSDQSINNGKADIKQLAAAFENLFNVSLGNYYRRFREIRLRKSGKTNFLDQIKVTLEKRLDEQE